MDCSSPIKCGFTSSPSDCDDLERCDEFEVDPDLKVECDTLDCEVVTAPDAEDKRNGKVWSNFKSVLAAMSASIFQANFVNFLLRPSKSFLAEALCFRR